MGRVHKTVRSFSKKSKKFFAGFWNLPLFILTANVTLKATPPEGDSRQFMF